MADKGGWAPLLQTVLAAFRRYGNGPEQGLPKSRVAKFLKELGLSDEESRLMLRTLGLIAEEDEIDFDAIVNWVFDGININEADQASANINDLGPRMKEQIMSCGDARAHIMYIQQANVEDEDAAEFLHMLIGGSRQSRIGVIGSISYDFPGNRYKAEGPEGVERIVRAAAETVVKQGKPTRVVCGGSYAGPQGTFGEVCDKYANLPVTMVHVLPNVDNDAALKDLKGILWDGDKPRVRKCRWRIAFVGSSIARRNCILASLNGNYIMCAGGPGTYTELCELRCLDAGLLPLVCSGGLAEGAAFGDKNANGMAEALQKTPPQGVTKESWDMMLGDGQVSFDQYLSAVEDVFGSLRFRGTSTPNNRWPMTEAERQAWEKTKQSTIFDAAKS
jgi:predicted Rossmann-fold nucleotide-binding protein